MESTGEIRRLDDLGRVVIPKQLRKQLRIEVGDPVEFFINDNGDIIIQKYEVIGSEAD